MAKSIAEYDAECIAVIGTKLFHDDSIDDRSEGGVQAVSYAETAKLWRAAYGEDYAPSGGGYLGQPPPEFFREDWPGLCPAPVENSNAKTLPWLSIDTPGAFVPVATGVVAQHTPGYVFGVTGPRGSGYYDIRFVPPCSFRQLLSQILGNFYLAVC